MTRHAITVERAQVHMWLMKSQVRQLERFQKLYGKNRTDLIAEILQSWFNQQEALHGDKLKELECKG